MRKNYSGDNVGGGTGPLNRRIGCDDLLTKEFADGCGEDAPSRIRIQSICDCDARQPRRRANTKHGRRRPRCLLQWIMRLIGHEWSIMQGGWSASHRKRNTNCLASRLRIMPAYRWR